jgi:hypothetical protein
MTMKGESAQQTEAGRDQGSIEALAYEQWLLRGSPIGSPEIDWLRAEEDLRSRTKSISRAA